MQKCAKLRRADEGLAARSAGTNSEYSKSGTGGMKEMRACSACAGSYEDPERTVRSAEEDDDEDGEGALQSNDEEFPAGD